MTVRSSCGRRPAAVLFVASGGGGTSSPFLATVPRSQPAPRLRSCHGARASSRPRCRSCRCRPNSARTRSCRHPRPRRWRRGWRLSPAHWGQHHIDDDMPLMHELGAEPAGFLARDPGVGLQPLVPLGQVNEAVQAGLQQGSQPACGFVAIPRARILPRRETARHNPVGVRHRPVVSTSGLAAASGSSDSKYQRQPLSTVRATFMRNPSRLPSASGVVASSTPPWSSSAAATTTEPSPTGASTVGSYATTPRHRGNSEQPQKSLPAFDPRRAVRLTMGRSHFGQFGIGSDAGTEVPLMSLTPWDQRSFLSAG